MLLRSYQSRIVAVAEKHNTIAVLPTGAGKTLVAAELIRRREGKALFLVPTVLLVSQQAGQLRSWTSADVGEYHGSATYPSDFDILVSTPKAFESAQLRDKAPAWSSFSTIIFDEVHHVLKEHPYRKLAVSLRRACPLPSGPRVLGLTASVTYAVEDNKVASSIRRLCDDLQVQKMETAGQDELRASGYHAFGTQAEVLTQAHIDLPGIGLASGVLDTEQRKPHLMASQFFGRVCKSEATQFACDLVRCIRSLEEAVLSADSSFKSPLNGTVNSWGKYAHDRQSRHSLYALLEHWYEALRLLVISWEEAADASICFLQMTYSFNAGKWPVSVDKSIQCLRVAYAEQPLPRFDHLKDVLAYKLDAASDARPFRGILFVQQRVMTHVLEHLIRNDEVLSSQLKPVCIYAQTSPATPSLRVTKAEARQRLRQFASGEANLLICTVVAEEGMDIPAANCVIRFDPVINTVSFNQGRGRARQEDSSFVIMREQEGRSAETLARAEKRQLEIVQNFQPAEHDTQSLERERSAQQQREGNARLALSSTSEASALSDINLYCKKAKVDLREHACKEATDWVYTLAYESVLRSISTRGVGKSKKEARKRAATDLIDRLLEES